MPWKDHQNIATAPTTPPEVEVICVIAVSHAHQPNQPETMGRGFSAADAGGAATSSPAATAAEAVSAIKARMRMWIPSTLFRVRRVSR